MIANTDIFKLTEAYFKQQAEIYGNDFYLETLPEPSLNEFYLQIKDCKRCKLWKHRTRFVFGTGNPDANLMCVGEAPGFDEDQQGEPFVGAAGQLLNRILKAIEFQREEVYIANIVKCRPPGNRDPEPEEAVQCLPYLKKQIDLVKPKLILALGRIAAQYLLNVQASISELRGKVHEIDGIKIVVTYHPAALLRNAQLKRKTWEDVQQLRRLYDQIVGDKPEFQPDN
ncbi:MAG: uracil-DNA glycosylase [Calditrichaeota bacterium]|nr:MAG: uracil-DNA glycosylase [Calditrichota bacterium]